MKLFRRGISEEMLRVYRDEKINNPTYAEIQAMWCLKKLRYKYRFQQIVGHYILDFVGVDYNFVLEVDGYTHDGKEEKDDKRDEMLSNHGLEAYRIANEDVKEKNLEEYHFKFVGSEYMKTRLNKINEEYGNYQFIVR